MKPPSEAKMDNEYLRRNVVHAASVGMASGANVALRRIRGWKRTPKWLEEILAGIAKRGEMVCPELARHRDEDEIVCPHCGKIGRLEIMQRIYFDDSPHEFFVECLNCGHRGPLCRNHEKAWSELCTEERE